VQKNTRQCRVFLFGTRQSSFFAECFFCRVIFIYRVPKKKHSANHMALGKEPDSGSDTATVSLLHWANLASMTDLAELLCQIDAPCAINLDDLKYACHRLLLIICMESLIYIVLWERNINPDSAYHMLLSSLGKACWQSMIEF
jgi:hypothetical protein